MRRNRDFISSEMERLGLTAPKVTPQMVDGSIVIKRFHHFEGTTVTVCLLTLYNGFTVVGQSACAEPANFNPELGQRLAEDDARDKIWAFLGFQLCEKKHMEAQNVDER